MIHRFRTKSLRYNVFREHFFLYLSSNYTRSTFFLLLVHIKKKKRKMDQQQNINYESPGFPRSTECNGKNEKQTKTKKTKQSLQITLLTQELDAGTKTQQWRVISQTSFVLLTLRQFTLPANFSTYFSGLSLTSSLLPPKLHLIPPKPNFT